MPDAPASRPRLRTGRWIRQQRRTLGGALVFVAAIVSALAAGALAPRDPLAQEVIARLQGPGWTDDEGRIAWLGTDHLGRNILSRLGFGRRVSMLVRLTVVVGSRALALLQGLD